MSEELQQSIDLPTEAISTGIPAADAEPSPSAPLADPPPSRPADVPEKFWNADEGALRTDALLKSYVELERKLGSMVPLPGDDDPETRQRLQRALGMPEAAEDYRIDVEDELLAADPAINAKLHEAGFTQQQAQLVYDLAADHLLPVIDDAIGELQATRDGERLAAHFGGEATWQNLAPQIRTWGRANLADEVYQTLASNYDGVLAMHQMMQAREPSVLQDADGPRGAFDEAALAQMMRDPRYWRDRDPAFVAEISAGFKRLYPS
jgi:Phage T7 capsid assembly protein